MTDTRDYRDTVFLPKTDFPMKAGLPAKEPGILATWQSADLYAQTRAARAGRETFILHDGPPYANGDMHIGHALNHILKDMVCRTQTLLGKDAPYVPGWDCHGLPIEWRIEEEYRKKKKNKDEVPPREFRAECRAYAQKWVDIQREQIKRLGVLGAWDKPYLTMAPFAEGTIVSELLKFAESGQLYRGAKPVMWSCVEKTALAEAEVEYEDITSTQIDVAFEIDHAPNAPELVGAHAVIWTTTPWTIPVNQAIAYGAEVDYVLAEFQEKRLPEFSSPNVDAPLSRPNRKLIVAKGLLQHVSDRLRVWDFKRVLWEGKGSQLAGATARHPMAERFLNPSPLAGEGGEAQPNRERGLDNNNPSPAATNAPSSQSLAPYPARGEGSLDTSPLAEFFARPRPFLDGSSFVTTDAGTGLVHMAPDHGEDDFALCKANGLNPVFAVEGDGKYRADWAWLGGQGPVVPYSPKGQDKLNSPDGPICTDLREAGALLSAADFHHSYPHSWRSKAKLIYRATPQWFVPMDRGLKPSPLQGRGLGEGMSPAAQPAGAPDGPSLNPSPEGEGKTLRETALAAIDATRFVPEKGRNRIRAMVEGRPDWVLSRQRAWGVPITLFVNRKTGDYLVDAQVNARIVAAVSAEGVDAWEAARAQEFLGAAYNADDYEMVTDILDVWFDSGCTHVFTLESGHWAEMRWPADLYLEGSDQHRGWFQSSLLESSGTRGRAPYIAVLTHGFTMDAKGEKMSKSKGNTINPLDLMRDYGADILRLWALSVDFTEDHRIGDEILKGVADQYRKLRNTFRYLLGALEGFDDAEKLPVADMPELERYMLYLLAELDGKLKAAVDEFDFNAYVRSLIDFCNEDLSAFFFDIRKDALYCEVNPASGYQTPERRAYRTVLDTLFHALVRYAAPVLVFTAEEVWGTRYPASGSVHLLEWPEVAAMCSGAGGSPEDGAERGSGLRRSTELDERWARLRAFRALVGRSIEPMRRDRVIGSSLETELDVFAGSADDAALLNAVDFAEICISSRAAAVVDTHDPPRGAEPLHAWVDVRQTTHHKCGRCWRHLPDVPQDGALCGRCADVLSQ